MRKFAAFLLILLFSFSMLYAQENEPSDGGEWDIYNDDSYTRGDQTFSVSLGALFPTVLLNNGKKMNNNFSPPVGGTGTLSYNYFFTPNIFLGGEVGGTFISTLADNMYYAILLGARTGYQFYFWRMEFPLNFSIGMIWHRYLDSRYYGLYLKAGGAAYYRFSMEWSFGLGTNWYWLPQWTNERAKNTDGFMIDLLLSARYHF